MIPSLLPWQDQQWHRIEQMGSVRGFPHALLLKGRAGVGKALFAQRLAAQLLCLERLSAPCGVCRGCTLVMSGSHPDFHSISPENNTTTITVSQIRELIDSLALTAGLSACKVGVIHPAERMTTAAANSLLKTLEEPPGETILILLTNASVQLPATVISRCHSIEFPPVPQSSGQRWLESELGPGHDAELPMKLSRGQPLTALDWVREEEMSVRLEVVNDIIGLLGDEPQPVSTASRWKEMGVRRILRWLDSLLMDFIKLAITGDNTQLTNFDATQSMQSIVSRLNLRTLFALLDTCRKSTRLVATHTGLNEQLMLEDLTVALVMAVRRGY